MNNKLISEKNAKKLIVGGVIGFVVGIILSIVMVYVILLPLYSQAGECITGSNVCSPDDFIAEQIGAKLPSVLMYASLAAIVTGIMMTIVLNTKGKQRLSTIKFTQPANSKTVKQLLIKIPLYIMAFFVGGSIASLIVRELVSVLFFSSDMNQQASIFAYLIIIFYPLSGGLMVCLINKWLKKKLF